MSTVPRRPGSVSPQPAATVPSTNPASTPSAPCPHPRVQIVARQQDSEFVECLECREIFESSEFQDLAIEEKIEPEGEVSGSPHLRNLRDCEQPQDTSTRVS